MDFLTDPLFRSFGEVAPRALPFLHHRRGRAQGPSLRHSAAAECRSEEMDGAGCEGMGELTQEFAGCVT